MESTGNIQEILVLEPDRLCGAIIAQTAGKLFPSARVHCESDPAVAAVVLAERSISLFIVALRGFDLDVITLLGVWAEHDVARTRVLVVTSDSKSAALRTLVGLPIAGVFDSSTGDLRDLEEACRAVANGKPVQSGAPHHVKARPSFQDEPRVRVGFLDDAVRINLPSAGCPVNTNLPPWRR